ncbi:hypothetical protein C4D60_Mb07t01810 [Musa balbisiana]|uniref:Terpene synthase metal-binding domain-containing protein n=1 Tax=Musa balbisiana TaxID=52838 RepID=A0A4S8JE40_MUSBA|nr:hypothetical protein C4D60_Mb07t01810 [Musa balbisiana]
MDINAIDKFPEYMKMCLLAVFNTANDAAYRITEEKNLDILPYLKRAWGDLCKEYLVEAKWYHRGHVPKLSDNLDNAWMSISGRMFLTNAFCINSRGLGKLPHFPRNHTAIVHASAALQ